MNTADYPDWKLAAKLDKCVIGKQLQCYSAVEKTANNICILEINNPAATKLVNMKYQHPTALQRKMALFHLCRFAYGPDDATATQWVTSLFGSVGG